MTVDEAIQIAVQKVFKTQFNQFEERLLQKLKPNLLLTVNEVAKVLRVSPRTVKNKIHSNKLKASFNGKWLIQESELNNYLKLNK